MRRATLLSFLSLCAIGCRCGPEVALPVTLRIKNSSPTPLFVDDRDGRLGLKVQRNVNGEWLSFVESPACECQACDRVCAGCSCDAGSAPSVNGNCPAVKTRLPLTTKGT